MAKQDYYELLGVSRDATDGEIKKAFRGLARELHPDVSGEPDAEERFREVAEAYEVLSDDDRRARYDRYGHEAVAGQGFHTERFMDLSFLDDLLGSLFGGGFAGATGPEAGADAQAAIDIDLADAAAGVHIDLDLELVSTCEVCEGDGAAPGADVLTCEECQGTGTLRQVVRSPLGQLMRTTPCRKCAGRGKIPERPCPDCRGRGRRPMRRALGVDIPAGIDDGQAVRITGHGHAGELGAPAGDLYVRVHVRPDERFVREGNDVYTTVDLTITQAALGATLTVPTLSGDTEMTFDPGTQPGEIVVLRGGGLPVLQGFGRGNQRVLVNVTVPRRLTEEQRQLLEEFDRLAGEETYEPGEGFFEKLKSAFR